MPRGTGSDTSPPSLDLSVQAPFDLGEWRVEPARLVVWRADQEVRLEPRVMGLLVALTRAEGEVVSRRELLETVWWDAVVGDDALTMAVSKLRRALASPSGGEALVETIPRVGYRMRTRSRPVLPHAPFESQELSGSESDPTAARTGAELGEKSHRRARLYPWWGLLAMAMLAGWWLLRDTAPAAPDPQKLPPRPEGLTAFPGLESQASFDPAGRRLVYQHRNDEGWGLAVLDLTNSESRPVYLGAAHSPVWSPVDQRIAFIRNDSGSYHLSLISSHGGPVEDLRSIEPSTLSGIDWSPEARSLAWANLEAGTAISYIEELDLDTGQSRRLTQPKGGFLGDGRPRYSPDGRYLAFTRGSNLYSYDLWLLDLQTRKKRQLTFDQTRIWGYDWLEDGSGLVFSSNRSGPFQLWSISLEGRGEPQWIPVAGERVRFPTIHGRQLVYDSFEIVADLFRLDADGTLTRLEEISTKGREAAPTWSPDGEVLAYGSNLSDTMEVWSWKPDEKPRRLSQLGASMMFQLWWSPDGLSLAALVILRGQSTIALVDRASGEHRILYHQNGWIPDGGVFAPDGRSVYFSSDRSGRLEIWRIGLEPGAEPEQITDFGASSIRFTPDGTALALHLEGDGLFRRQRDGRWTPLLPDFQPLIHFSWALVGQDLHALHPAADGAIAWHRWSLEEGASEVVARFPPRLENGALNVAPDGASATVGRLLALESDLRRATLPSLP